jgi:hypothetical protein
MAQNELATRWRAIAHHPRPPSFPRVVGRAIHRRKSLFPCTGRGAEALPVLPLKRVVSRGNAVGFGVRVLKSYNINRHSRVRPKTRLVRRNVTPSESETEKPLEGAAQLLRCIRLGQHHSTLDGFAGSQLDALMRLPNVYTVVKIIPGLPANDVGAGSDGVTFLTAVRPYLWGKL